MSEKTEKPKGPDTRTIAERICSVKAGLGNNCIVKNGVKVIRGSRIEYVMSDDLMELLRQRLAAEGLDLRVAMDPTFPVREITFQTQDKKTRSEYQAWFTIITSAGGESQVDHWLAQDADLGIAATFAFKYWLLKRFQLSGGNGDGVNPDYLEAESTATATEESKVQELKLTEEQKKKASLNKGKATGKAGPEKPEEAKVDLNTPAAKEDIQKVWKRWSDRFGEGAKSKFSSTFPDIKSFEGATLATVHRIWDYLDSLGEE